MSILVKKMAVTIYFCLCLAALTGEPTLEKPITLTVAYYSFVMLNLAISISLINKTFKTNVTTSRN